MNPIHAIQQQIDVSEDIARQALEKHNGDVTEAILYLYNVPPPPPKPITEWDERRSICQAYEEQMTEFIQKNSICHSPNPQQPDTAPVRTIFRNPILD